MHTIKSISKEPKKLQSKSELWCSHQINNFRKTSHHPKLGGLPNKNLLLQRKKLVTVACLVAGVFDFLFRLSIANVILLDLALIQITNYQCVMNLNERLCLFFFQLQFSGCYETRDARVRHVLRGVPDKKFSLNSPQFHYNHPIPRKTTK